MAVEDRYINVGQRVTQTGTSLEIFLFYQDEGAVQLAFFVPIIDEEREGVSFIGGDLGYTYQNISAIFLINEAGDLIVNDINPAIYSIDNAGDLNLTTT